MPKKYGNGATGPSTAEDWKDWLSMKIEERGNSWPTGSVMHLMEVMREMATELMDRESQCIDPTAFPKDRQEDS